MNKLRINKKTAFFFIIIMLFIVLLILNSERYKELYISSEIIDYDSYKNIVESRDEYNEIINLYYDDNLVPYSVDENYYLFYDANGKEYEKIYCDSNFKVNIVSKINEYTFSIIIYNDSYYKVSDLILTNIPVIAMNTENIENDKNYGKIYLYSPNDRFNTTDAMNYNCEFHIRGNSIRYYDKTSYRLNIFNNKGKDLEIKALGMDSDSDWILNPLGFDKSYVREKVAYDIWDSLSSKYNHAMEYVELILDNKYQGIYCLQEVVDMDTFSADKNKDLLVSIRNLRENITDPVLFGDVNKYEEIIDEFEIEKGLDNNYDLRIDLLRAFINKIDNNSENNAQVEYDMESNGKYVLFINLISATDNYYFNQKIFFKDMRRLLYYYKNSVGFRQKYVK